MSIVRLAHSVPTMSTRGSTAFLSLARPNHANRIELADLPVLTKHFADVSQDPKVRVLVLQSKGNHFCSGFDINQLMNLVVAPGGDPGVVNPFESMVNALQALSKPTIASVHAGMYGGAIDLALACDFRLGTQRCKMSMPALRIGLQYYASGLERYVTQLGMQASRRIFMTASTFGADEMLRMRVLDELYDDEESLRTAVVALADQLAGMAPLPMAATKRALAEIALGRLDRQQLHSAERLTFASSDLREGIAASQVGRTPTFSGR